jgi:hypothetical protein
MPARPCRGSPGSIWPHPSYHPSRLPAEEATAARGEGNGCGVAKVAVGRTTRAAVARAVVERAPALAKAVLARATVERTTVERVVKEGGHGLAILLARDQERRLARPATVVVCVASVATAAASARAKYARRRQQGERCGAFRGQPSTPQPSYAFESEVALSAAAAAAAPSVSMPVAPGTRRL